LIRIIRQRALLIRHLTEESKAARAICGDAIAIHRRAAADKLAEIVPVEITSVPELLQQAVRLEAIPRLP
jgi:hypothetical protein